MWTFRTLGATYLNYTHPGTRAPTGADPVKDQVILTTVISNLFPYIMFQTVADESARI